MKAKTKTKKATRALIDKGRPTKPPVKAKTVRVGAKAEAKFGRTRPNHQPLVKEKPALHPKSEVKPEPPPKTKEVKVEKGTVMPKPDLHLLKKIDECKRLDQLVFETADSKITVRPSILFSTEDGRIKIKGYFPYYFRNNRSYLQAMKTINHGLFSTSDDDLFETPEQAMDAWNEMAKQVDRSADPTQPVDHPRDVKQVKP